jgi:hypothetical protein
MATRLQTQLRAYGIHGSPADFRDLLSDLKAAAYPNITDEDLSITGPEADQYYDLVRNRVGIPGLPRPFILRTLLGIRKHAIKI